MNKILMHALIFMGLLIASAYMFTRFRWGSFALAFACAWVALIVVLWFIFFPPPNDINAKWYLMSPLLLGAPTSFLLPSVGGPTFVDKVIGLTILGIVQYGAIGFLIDFIISKRKKRNC